MSEKRLKYRNGLSPLFVPYYDALCALLPSEWDPYSGFRSFEEQEKLYSNPARVTRARGGESPHNYGCAADFTVWEGHVPLWLPKEDPKWHVFVNAVTKVGLRPGSEWGDMDHAELSISCSWKKVNLARLTYGEDYSLALIEKSLCK